MSYQHYCREHKKQLLHRFLQYVAIDTASDADLDTHPSTDGQLQLLRQLKSELQQLGVNECAIDQHGYLIARLYPHPKAPDQSLYIGFMAHVDTSADCSSRDIHPLIVEEYDGSVIARHGGSDLDPALYPELGNYKGHTVVTSDGRTLLGADDKAGIAIIMTMLDILGKHPEIHHPGIEIVFTPDEETGKGMDFFPVQVLKSSYCYTIDGDTRGTMEAECFNAWLARVSIRGKPVHLGAARGRLVNAVRMAGDFLNLIPQSESPETSDGRMGYYCPHAVTADISEARLDILLRDYSREEIKRKMDVLRSISAAVEAAHPGGEVVVSFIKQYENMLEHINKYPQGLDLLRQAIRASGLEPVMKSIRGGTDGARLTEMGIPAPNVFTGGRNFHSVDEYVSLDVMLESVEVLLNLNVLWTSNFNKN